MEKDEIRSIILKNDDGILTSVGSNFDDNTHDAVDRDCPLSKMLYGFSNFMPKLYVSLEPYLQKQHGSVTNFTAFLEHFGSSNDPSK